MAYALDSESCGFASKPDPCGYEHFGNSGCGDDDTHYAVCLHAHTPGRGNRPEWDPRSARPDLGAVKKGMAHVRYQSHGCSTATVT